jgi:hypothetical protein
MPLAGHFAIAGLNLGIADSCCSTLAFGRLLSTGFGTAFMVLLRPDGAMKDVIGSLADHL